MRLSLNYRQGGNVSRVPQALLAVLIGLGFAACDGDDGGTEPELAFEEEFPTSLHATAAGMEYWYEQPDGYGAFIDVAYSELGCGDCHANNPVFQAEEGDPCSACHQDGQGNAVTPGPGTVPESACFQCHSRQGAEVALGVNDVHRELGMRCQDCHDGHEVHGDGTAYNSFFEKSGEAEASCEGCHEDVASNTAHDLHNGTVACQACHMATSVTCVNCHLEAEVAEHRKVAYRKVKGWQFLGNWRGKVYPFNFQSVKYGDETFVALAPFSGHTICRAGQSCTMCHDGDAAAQYRTDGSIDVLRWDDRTGVLVPIRGVVPIPPDWRTALRFDFVTLRGDDPTNPADWTFLEAGPDNFQMLFGEPLTAGQVEKLTDGPP